MATQQEAVYVMVPIATPAMESFFNVNPQIVNHWD